MDGETTLSKIDMQASEAFRQEMAEHICLHVKEKLRKRTDGVVTCWDVNSTTLSKIISHQAILWQVLSRLIAAKTSPPKPLIIPLLLC